MGLVQRRCLAPRNPLGQVCMLRFLATSCLVLSTLTTVLQQLLMKVPFNAFLKKGDFHQIAQVESLRRNLVLTSPDLHLYRVL